MTIVYTYRNLNNPKKAAEAFQLALAADRGYSSKLKTITGGYRVVASDGKAVDFLSN